MKKSWALLAILLLMLGLCFAAAAEEAEPTEYTSGDYKYILLPDGTAEITSYSGTATDLTVPDLLDGHRVTSIGDYAFFSCDQLTSISLPDYITEIKANPFKLCSNLKQIRVSPDQPVFATIDGILFNKTEKSLVCYPRANTATEYQIPNGICSIGNSAFYACANLSSITLPKGITDIGNSAFFACDSLKSISMPEGLTHIGDEAFYACDSLTSIILLDGLKSIGASAFNNCQCLVSITLPKGVANIGDSAFSSCFNLTSITLPEGLISIGDSAFSCCLSLTRITIPDSVIQIGANPFVDCRKLTKIHVSQDHPIYATIDGVLFSKENKELICYPCSFTTTEYQIPEDIQIIGAFAFNGCSNLKNITLSEELNNIGIYAFTNCADDMLFTVVRDSWAAKWCKENGKNYTYTDSLDWLND